MKVFLSFLQIFLLIELVKGLYLKNFEKKEDLWTEIPLFQYPSVKDILCWSYNLQGNLNAYILLFLIINKFQNNDKEFIFAKIYFFVYSVFAAALEYIDGHLLCNYNKPHNSYCYA